MKSALILLDPISTGVSVQLNLLSLATSVLEGYDKIDLFVPFVSSNRAKNIRRIVPGDITSLSSERRFLHFIYAVVEKNEAVLWAFSWLFEALFSANSGLLSKSRNRSHYDSTINMSYTVPARCDLLWNQATPPLETLRVMGTSNFIARIMYRLGKLPIRALDDKLRRKHRALSGTFANNSVYLKNLYAKMNWHSDWVINVPKLFRDFLPPNKIPSRDYVLAYIGKEIEIDTLLRLAREGVTIVSFGAKIPPGTPLKNLKEEIGFRGFVSEDDLAELYYNAKFTVFPFTEEPFGWVPLESMHYGTPILSYDKQGPSETIINGVTGWLVKTKREFISMGVRLWKSEKVGINSEDCRERAESYSVEKTRDRVKRAIAGEPAE